MAPSGLAVEILWLARGGSFLSLLKVIEGQRAGKGHILLLDKTTKGTFEAQRAQCPLVEA